MTISKTLKIHFACVSFVLAIMTCGIVQCPKLQKYEIELTFCDNRKPLVIVVEQRYPPSVNDIERSDESPVTTYDNYYLNVCDVKILRYLH